MHDNEKILITKETKKEVLLKLGADCRKCGNCCSFGSGFVLDNEIKELAKNLNINVKKFRETYLEEIERFNTKLHRFRLVQKHQKHPYGNCVFLKNNNCIIHDIKPLHCRIASCGNYGEDINEWFFVNYFVNASDPESVRQWHTRLKIKGTIKGGEIESLIPHEKVRKMILNRKI